MISSHIGYYSLILGFVISVSLLFYSIFCFCFINSFYYLDLYLLKKIKNLNLFRISTYSSFALLIFLLLTRPTSLPIAYLVLFFISLSIVFKSKNIYVIRNELLILNLLLFSITIYCSSLYYQYAITSWSWLDSNPVAIEKYDGVANVATYFGIPEVNIKSNLISYLSIGIFLTL